MNLKKLFVLSLATLLITISVPCFAQMPKAEMVVGGLYIGQRFSEVMEMYGRPSGIMKETEDPGRVFSFTEENGTEFNVRIIDDRVAGLELFGKNSLSTKAGIRIGSTVRNVKRAYGNPDDQRGTKDDGIMYYKCDAGNRHTWILIIEVKSGKVVSIEMSDFTR